MVRGSSLPWLSASMQAFWVKAELQDKKLVVFWYLLYVWCVCEGWGLQLKRTPFCRWGRDIDGPSPANFPCASWPFYDPLECISNFLHVYFLKFEYFLLVLFIFLRDEGILMFQLFVFFFKLLMILYKFIFRRRALRLVHWYRGCSGREIIEGIPDGPIEHYQL